jgi:hypothetical protein
MALARPRLSESRELLRRALDTGKGYPAPPYRPHGEPRRHPFARLP